MEEDEVSELVFCSVASLSFASFAAFSAASEFFSQAENTLL